MQRILFIGNFEDAAYQTIVNTINAGQIDAVVIKTPPMYGELGKYLLEDIAIYANCEVITDNQTLRTFGTRFIGSLDKVIASKSEATLFASNETEAVRTRIQVIKDQVEIEESPAVAEKPGRIAVQRVGRDLAVVVIVGAAGRQDAAGERRTLFLP